MIIREIALKDFRNYDNVKIEFSDGVNILYGENAQGKTNILEACYLCSTGKSHKGAKDREMINFNADEGHVRSVVFKDERETTIDIHLRGQKTKGVAVNHVPARKSSELYGLLNIVLFSPEDLSIIKSGPEKRRRFMDSELCQIDKIYLYNLKKYHKVLDQRNKLLKDILKKPALKDTLSVWDEKLVEYGNLIIKTRSEFVLKLFSKCKDIHSGISGGKEEIGIFYEPSVTEKIFEEKLFMAGERDMYSGTTSVGPHRDDIKITINDIDIRKYGSQGQQRTAALSLKLSEIAIMEETIKDKPVLLLDDVLSELDSNRQKDLLNSIKGTQTIITCTGLDEFVKNRFESDKVFNVKNGEIKEITLPEEL